MDENSLTPSNRRDLLKRAAIVGGAAAVAPMLVSSTALADAGTVKCRYTYTSPANVQWQIGRAADQSTEQVRLGSITPPSGVCPCGESPVPIVRWAYSVTFTPLSGGGPANTASSTDFSLAVLPSPINVPVNRGDSNFGFDVRFGVAIQCPGIGATPAIICRFFSATGTTTGVVDDDTLWPSTSPGSFVSGDLTDTSGFTCPTSLP